VLIFYYFYHGIRAVCLEQALFSLPIHHWCCPLRQRLFPSATASLVLLISTAPPFFLVVAIFLPL
ncbi:unnamed protein product, partial [Musa acuminata subsp. burmannicoides]